MLTEHETWQVQDSTKVQAFMECPRKYFWRYVLGWEKEEPNVHLVFGIAWHKAMELMLLGKSANEPYNIDSLPLAFDAFLNEYRKSFQSGFDEDNDPKCPDCAARGLVQYFDLYSTPDKEWEVLWTEIAGSIDIGLTNPIYFRSDAIIRNGRGVLSLEHKTGRAPSRSWCDQWMQKIQTGTYSHVLYACFPDEKVEVRINGFFPHTPRLKKNGEPYANSRDNEFFRVPVRRTLGQMEDWLSTVKYWASSINIEFDKLLSHSGDLLTAFPKNTEHCSSYFGCPYFDYCIAWENPLERTEQVQPGFKVRFWDPREAKAKKVVRV